MTMLVRLKPYNEKKGHLTRTYMIDGLRFYEGRVYEVEDAVAERLRGLTQDHYDGDSPELFDVGTKAEFERLERREADAVRQRATAASPAPVDNTRGRRRVVNNAGEPGQGGDTTTAQIAPTPKRKLTSSPANNQGEPGGGGDTTTADISTGGGQVLDPDPDGKEAFGPDDEGRATEIGRVSSASESTSPKSRTKR